MRPGPRSAAGEEAMGAGRQPFHPALMLAGYALAGRVGAIEAAVARATFVERHRAAGGGRA